MGCMLCIMQINDFLAKANLTETAFAGQLGLSQAQVNRLRHGARVTAELAVKIEAATEGAVSRSELRPDLWPTPSPRTEAA